MKMLKRQKRDAENEKARGRHREGRRGDVAVKIVRHNTVSDISMTAQMKDGLNATRCSSGIYMSRNVCIKSDF